MAMGGSDSQENMLKSLICIDILPHTDLSKGIKYYSKVLGKRAGGDDTFRCVPEDTRTNKDWTVRMNGFRFRLQG